MGEESLVEDVHEMQDAQPTKAKRGRPRGDYTNLVGTMCNGHEILSVLEGPRSRQGVKVVARCPKCGHPFETRLRRLRGENPKGCRCVRSEKYREYLKRRLSELRPETIAGCWVSRRSMTRKKTAAKFGLRVEVVDAAQREYQTKLDLLIENRTALRLHRMIRGADGDPVTMTGAGAEFGLPMEAVQYLVSAGARQMKEDSANAAFQLSCSQLMALWASKVLSEVEQRESKRKRWIGWVPELMPKELRMEKGKLVGRHAALYEFCMYGYLSGLNRDERADVDEFLEIARRTLANRLDRRASYLKSVREKRAASAEKLGADGALSGGFGS